MGRDEDEDEVVVGRVGYRLASNFRCQYVMSLLEDRRAATARSPRSHSAVRVLDHTPGAAQRAPSAPA